jgi:hypothetical protein
LTCCLAWSKSFAAIGTANFVSIVQTYSSEKPQKQGQKPKYRSEK